MTKWSWLLILAMGASQALAQKPTQSYSVETVALKPQTTLVIKVQGHEYEKMEPKIKELIGKVEAHLKAKNIKAQGAPFSRMLLYKQGFLDFETGFPVPDGTKGEGDLVTSKLPGGNAAKTVHTGTHLKSHHAYEALHSYRGKQKLKQAGPAWEVYVDKNKTEVFLPLKEPKK